MTILKLFDAPSKTAASNVAPMTSLQTGVRYPMSCPDYRLLNATHGVIGDYRISKQSGEILSISPLACNASMAQPMNACYFWDASIDLSQLEGQLTQNKNDCQEQFLSIRNCQLTTSRLILNSANMGGPELFCENNITSLQLSPNFDFSFITDSHSVQLGVVNLVKAHRIIKLENNTDIVLLDTGIDESPVLYLENSEDEHVVKLITSPQQAGITYRDSCTFLATQIIPETIATVKVATVTVLEQYYSYFMQRIVGSDSETIWTPLYAPITWGWSIRVGRRADGEWGILRRKLILPTTGNDGWQMPVWSNNTVNCSTCQEKTLE